MGIGIFSKRPELPPYERNIYQFLAVLRFFFFAGGLALTLSALTLPPTNFTPYVFVGLIGVYTLARVIYRFPIWSSNLIVQIVLWSDLAICISVVLLTGGLDSAFLLYSLLPIFSAALLSEQRIALSFATLSSIALITAHIGLSWAIPTFAWVLDSNYLAWLILYVGISGLIVVISYGANINARRRVENEAALRERNRLRRELHDSLAQNLGFLKLKTGHMADLASRQGKVDPGSLAEISSVAGICYHDLRESLDLLIAPTKGFSLARALANYVQNWTRRSGIPVDLVQPRPFPVLIPTTRFELLRIVQGALSNVQRHSVASQAWVELKNTPQGMSLVIKDDGCGFSPSDERGHGLSIMEERAQNIGGTLSISSTPGQGTEIAVTIPKGGRP